MVHLINDYPNIQELIYILLDQQGEAPYTRAYKTKLLSPHKPL
jgi:hypothetical protein